MCNQQTSLAASRSDICYDDEKAIVLRRVYFPERAQPISTNDLYDVEIDGMSVKRIWVRFLPISLGVQGVKLFAD